MKKTQLAWVEKELRTRGYITRNEMLREYISRGSAIICALNKKGYVIEGENLKTGTKSKWGTAIDYKYTLKYRPINPVFIKE